MKNKKIEIQTIKSGGLIYAISQGAIRNRFSMPRGKIEKNRRLFSNAD